MYLKFLFRQRALLAVFTSALSFCCCLHLFAGSLKSKKASKATGKKTGKSAGEIMCRSGSNSSSIVLSVDSKSHLIAISLYFHEYTFCLFSSIYQYCHLIQSDFIHTFTNWLKAIFVTVSVSKFLFFILIKGHCKKSGVKRYVEQHYVDNSHNIHLPSIAALTMTSHFLVCSEFKTQNRFFYQTSVVLHYCITPTIIKVVSLHFVEWLHSIRC